MLGQWSTSYRVKFSSNLLLAPHARLQYAFVFRGDDILNCKLQSTLTPAFRGGLSIGEPPR